MRIANLETDKRRIAATLGAFGVLEYLHDASVSPADAVVENLMGQMGEQRRQLVVQLHGGNSVLVQTGSMQWIAGKVHGSVPKKSDGKPKYTGEGLLVFEPTCKYLILQDVASWGAGGMTVENSMFLACDGTVNVASWGSNLYLCGEGVAALECNVPADELVEVVLEDDELRIDGDLAVCWSKSISFNVESSTKSLSGLAVSGKHVVSVYRGTGKVLMCPFASVSSHEEDMTFRGATNFVEDSW